MSLPTFSVSTIAKEAADALSEEIQGKNVLITGTSIGGLGFEVVRVIAKYANLVIITGYNAERLKASEEALKKEVPSANIRTLVLDLMSFAQIRKAAAEVNAYPEPIHVLINNAAAPIGPYKLSADGYESQTATDIIGPFLFTKLVLPKLLEARTPSYTPRVLWLSSTGHAFIPGLDLNVLIGKPDPATYHAFNSYSHTKGGNILLASEFARRAGGKIDAFSLCPGLVFTNIHQKPESYDIMVEAGFITPDKKPSLEKFDSTVWKSIPQGASTIVIAAFDPRISGKSGTYLSNGVEANHEVAPHCSDPATAEKLWTATEEIVGEKFTI